MAGGLAAVLNFQAHAEQGSGSAGDGDDPGIAGSLSRSERDHVGIEALDVQEVVVGVDVPEINDGAVGEGQINVQESLLKEMKQVQFEFV